MFTGKLLFEFISMIILIILMSVIFSAGVMVGAKIEKRQEHVRAAWLAKAGVDPSAPGARQDNVPNTFEWCVPDGEGIFTCSSTDR